MEAAPEAIPVNPKIAATIAITRKIADHLSIINCFWLLNKYKVCKQYHIHSTECLILFVLQMYFDF